MRRMGRLGFSVNVSPAGPSGKDSKVRVRSTLERFGLPGMELAASSASGRAPHVDPSRLPDGLGWSVDDRLRHAGARKGRVLAIWQGETLVAACTWHLHEAGPPVIFDLGARSDLTEAQPAGLHRAAGLSARYRTGARSGRRRIALERPSAGSRA
jgi:hypothetical protein